MKTTFKTTFKTSLLCLALLSTSVFAAGADTSSTASSANTQSQDSNSSAGNNFNQDFGHNTSNAVDVSRSVGAAIAPNLATTLTETCMGSTSVGAGWSGFGASFGTTWRDSSCTRRLDARQVSAFGDVATAREMMCESQTMRDAAKRVGRPCMLDNAGGVAYGIAVPVANTQTEIVPTLESAAPVVQQKVHE